MIETLAIPATQVQQARAFAALHIKGEPVELFNIWDAGSARAVADGGATALATGSWSVAAAQGYPDGEGLPLDLLLTITRRIGKTVDLPLTVDFEGGFETQGNDLAANIERLIEAGAIGINFEDQIVGGDGLHDIARQANRIATLRSAADALGCPLFINARTDLFLNAVDPARHSDLLDLALERAQAYIEAGASGVFLPGLADLDLVERACDTLAAPVNIMMTPDGPSSDAFAQAGVSRLSHGPFPYIALMDSLRKRAVRIYGR